MKFVLSSYGGRGDIEPAVVVGRELLRRGHDVRMVVPPNLVGFAEAAGLPAVAYGLDSKEILELQWRYFTVYGRTPWKLKELNRMAGETAQFAQECWAEMTRTLASVAEGADLLLTGLIFEQPAANVAEAYDIPLVTLHYFPYRVHGQLLPLLPSPLSRMAMTVNEWTAWRGTRKGEDAQRRELGLPKATSPAPRRIADRSSLEIQAYDELVFPGLAGEWAKGESPGPVNRPFVGALAMASPTDVRCGGGVLDRRRNAADLLRVRQRTDRLAGRHDRHDRRSVRTVGGARDRRRGRYRLQQRPAVRPCEGGRPGELRDDLPVVPRGRASRRLGHSGRVPAGGRAPVGALDTA